MFVKTYQKIGNLMKNALVTFWFSEKKYFSTAMDISRFVKGRQNYIAIYRHLKSYEKRLSKKSSKNVELYSNQIEELLSRNFAKKLSLYELENYQGSIYYLTTSCCS